MTSSLILKFISQEDVFNRYFGPFQLKKYYVNPWRKDGKPGCWFTYRNNNLYFVDFGNDSKNISCFQACMYYYNCSFQEALIHIDLDFNLNLSPECLFKKNINEDITERKTIHDNFKNSNFNSRKDVDVKVEYDFKYQEFQDYDIAYWKSYGYNKELIEKLKIKSAKEVYRDGKIWTKSFAKNPIYTYNDSLGEFKIYRPYSGKHLKWRSLRPILEGYELLEDSDLLFITSSYKDVGVIKSLGYQAMCPPSETSYNLLYDKMSEFKERFKYIYVFHNSDVTGKSFSLKITQDHNLYYINTPNNGPKDPSDFVKEYGIEKLEKLINEKLKRDGYKNS